MINAMTATTLALRNLQETAWKDSLCTCQDASIVAASVVAMILLTNKRVESWLLWI